MSHFMDDWTEYPSVDKLKNSPSLEYGNEDFYRMDNLS